MNSGPYRSILAILARFRKYWPIFWPISESTGMVIATLIQKIQYCHSIEMVEAMAASEKMAPVIFSKVFITKLKYNITKKKNNNNNST
jgi:hypothetical protein